MKMLTGRPRGLRPLALVAVLALAFAPMTLRGGGFGHKSQPPVYVPVAACPPPTVFSVDSGEIELVVRVVGPQFADLEVYFKLAEPYQNVKKDTVQGGANLHLNGSLTLAPANPAGTFAVRYGQCHDMFRIYSWTKEASDLNVYGPCSPEPGYPVHLEFVAPRLLRVAYGKDGVKTKYYRCLPNSNNWTDAEATLNPLAHPCP